MEAILLAGGLGTRLHSVTGDLYPKSLAPVNHHPFLHYVILYLRSQGVNRFIFAVSHHSKMIIESVQKTFPDLDAVFSKEEKPLGTGGAIKQAINYVKGNQVLVVNSDSFMEFSLKDFVKFSNENRAQLSLIGTYVEDVSRFGSLDIDDGSKLKKFFEKGKQGAGYINSGVYLIDTNIERLACLKGKFSFEHDVLSNEEQNVYVMKNKGLFLISVPRTILLAHSV